MDSMEEQYGYDGNFIGDIPDYFKCVVCHLVLRQPVQIMSCGHRFCKPCFNRIEGYSKYLNTVLCCPIDREEVDMNKVFEDTAVAREIGNLQVKCTFSSQGCSWQGDLRCIQNHEKDCQYKVKIPDEGRPVCKEEEDVLLKELLQRVQNCEHSLLGKEKDIASLKFNFDEMKSLSEKKEKELYSMKTLNTELKNELQVVKRLNEELKVQFDEEVLVLKDEIKILETKVHGLEEQIAVSEDGLKEEKDNEMLEKKMKDMHFDFTNKLSDQKQNVQSEFAKSLIPVKKELSALQKDVQKTFNEIKAVRSHTDKTFNKKANEITNIITRLEDTEKLLESDKVKELATHVDNIENILFYYTPYVDKQMKFKWVLTNCNSHFEKGERVYSPMFYPQINGYCFKLFVQWTGPNKENLGLYLWLHRGRNDPGDLKPFRVPYEFAVLHKNGTYKKIGDGGYEMFTMPEVQDYIINGTMYITLTFDLS